MNTLSVNARDVLNNETGGFRLFPPKTAAMMIAAAGVAVAISAAVFMPLINSLVYRFFDPVGPVPPTKGLGSMILGAGVFGASGFALFLWIGEIVFAWQNRREERKAQKVKINPKPGRQ